MRRKLSELRYGESVHDMHYGLPDPAELFGKGVRLVSHVRFHQPQAGEVVKAMLRTRHNANPDACHADAGYGYANKLLVFVGAEPYPDDHFVFAYAYDDRMFGLVVVAQD